MLVSWCFKGVLWLKWLKIGVLVKKKVFFVKKTRKPGFFSHYNSG
jgi:hypothetical protein